MGDCERLEKKLLGLLGSASKEFGLVEPNDRIMVGVSGGKDSWTLLHLLRLTQRRVGFPVELVAVNLDQGHPGFPVHVLREYFEREGYEYRIVARDTYSVVKEKVPAGKTYCSLCSRLRRGILYDVAVELGCNKIALGHHRDDVVETLMLNLMFSGQIKAMPPRLRSDDGRNVVIRPLVYCDEADIAEYARLMNFPVVPCDLCGSQENLQRKQVKRLLQTLGERNPHVRNSMFAALSNVRPSHLFDRGLRRTDGDDGPGTDEAVP